MVFTQAERTKRWRQKHPERARAMLYAWRKKNPDKFKEHIKRWEAKNIEKVKGYHRNAVKKYRENNIEKVREFGRLSAAKHRKDHPDEYKEWREKNIIVVRQKNREKINERREYVRQCKNKPCADCGIQYDSIAMDFDHIGKNKVFGVAKMVSFSKARLDAEISKCEVVCANCHRIRTRNRRNNDAT